MSRFYLRRVDLQQLRMNVHLFICIFSLMVHYRHYDYMCLELISPKVEKEKKRERERTKQTQSAAGLL